VRLNRNERNLGLIAHIYHRLELIDTDIVIGSAGDDVSEPTRVEELMAAWARDPAADAVCSGATYIDASGKVLGVQRTPPSVHYQGLRERLLGRLILRTNFLYGANAGWKRSLYLDYPKIPSGVAEDMVIGVRALLGGGIAFVDKPLVRYRKHDSNLWSVNSVAPGQESETLYQRRAAMTLLSAKQHEIDLDHAMAVGKLDKAVVESLRPVFRVHRLLAEIAGETRPDNAQYVAHLLARDWIATRRMSRTRLTPWRFSEAKLLQYAQGFLRRFVREDIAADARGTSG
jgi:hypothetical protein